MLVVEHPVTNVKAGYSQKVRMDRMDHRTPKYHKQEDTTTCKRTVISVFSRTQ